MKALANIKSAIIFLLLIAFIYFNIQFEQIEVDTYSDGQAGIGKGIIGIIVISIGLIFMILFIASIFVFIFKKQARNIQLIISIIISFAVVSYTFFRFFSSLIFG